MTSLRLAALPLLLSLTLVGCVCQGPKLKQVEELVPPPEPDAGTCVAELCNGRDDDCDGVIDEELGTITCGVGACARTVPACVSGGAGSCTPLSPSPETCNGLDDDCDGMTDEELMPAMCGVGECAAVGSTCVDGVQTACMPGTPRTETCNGKDDDCDGTVDEELLTNTSGDVRITNDPASSDYVYIGRSGTGFGVVWQDKRDVAAGQIYFTGLTSRGARLASNDLRVSNTQGSSSHPALAWNGQSWGLVYADDAPGDAEIYFRPLAANGQPTAAAIRLTNATGDSDWPDLVWTGSSYAVAYDDQRAGAGKHDLYFQRFDRGGTRLGGEVRVTTDPARQSNPILKWNGSEFGLAWTDYRFTGNREVYFRRLAADGSLLGPEVRVTNDAADSAWPDLAWNDADRQWALVWHDTRDGNAEVYFARLDANGTRLGPDTRLTNAAGFSGYPSVDWNGFQYGVSWQDDRLAANKPAIYFAQVSATGAKNGTELKLSSGSGSASFTTALWNGNTFAFCWRDDRNGTSNTELYFALVGCPN
ncbi:MAG: MopE-related protein [Myxococcota bacterium]